MFFSDTFRAYPDSRVVKGTATDVLLSSTLQNIKIRHTSLNSFSVNHVLSLTLRKINKNIPKIKDVLSSQAISRIRSNLCLDRCEKSTKMKEKTSAKHHSP